MWWQLLVPLSLVLLAGCEGEPILECGPAADDSVRTASLKYTALPPGPRPLRIMTFNIKHGVLQGLEAVADVINAEAPDLVALQEVDDGSDRSCGENQAARLGQLTGMASVIRHATLLSAGGHQSNALLSRLPLVSTRRVALPRVGDSEQRILLVARVALTAEQTIPVGVTHLSRSSQERELQAREIVDQLGDERLAVVAGDMNASPERPAAQILTSCFTDVWPQAGEGQGHTLVVYGPGRRIDYILLGQSWPKATESHTVDTQASDHLALVATVPWPLSSQ